MTRFVIVPTTLLNEIAGYTMPVPYTFVPSVSALVAIVCVVAVPPTGPALNMTLLPARLNDSWSGVPFVNATLGAPALTVPEPFT